MNQEIDITLLPPQSIEAEQALLGCILLDKDILTKIEDLVKPEDFYQETHRIIFQAIKELYEARSPIDLLSLSNRLEEKNQLENIGGRSYLVSLVNSVPTAAHASYYAEMVQEKSTLRRLIKAGENIVSLGYKKEEIGIEEILDKSEQEVFKVSQKYLKENFIPLKKILGETFERLEEIHREKGRLRGISTGFIDLDRMLAGFQRSDLIILAGRPSSGKTSLALDIARHAAIRERIPVGIFSLEMSKEQLVERLLSAESQVDFWKMRTGALSEKKYGEEDDDFTKIAHAYGVLSETPLFVYDSPSANIMEIRTKARRLQAEHGLGLLILDYLQLMQGISGKENRTQEISEISRALKSLARELDIPVLALSQLSRQVEFRHPPIPILADLRESGAIEQDADVVIFIYREVLYKKDTQRKNIAEIHISKHRNGPTGQIDLYFDEERVTFRNLEETHLL